MTHLTKVVQGWLGTGIQVFPFRDPVHQTHSVIYRQPDGNF